MELINFIEITPLTAILLILVGFVGGMVSGFIGSGGAFVLTPAMMTLGAPGIVAVASNICHKFPKALVGAVKRNKYGQVDVKLGLVLGLFAEGGVLFGKSVMTNIKNTFGAVGTDLYVSGMFVVTLAIVGGFVFKDYRKLKALDAAGDGSEQTAPITKLARWVQSVKIPGTMIYSKGAQAEISFLFLAPIGFATGFLASAIAVGGFIGLPAIMASATELVIAFIMGLGGTIFYGLEGMVDIRLAMLILLGSLFGIQGLPGQVHHGGDHADRPVLALLLHSGLPGQARHDRPAPRDDGHDPQMDRRRRAGAGADRGRLDRALRPLQGDEGTQGEAGRSGPHRNGRLN